MQDNRLGSQPDHVGVTGGTPWPEERSPLFSLQNGWSTKIFAFLSVLHRRHHNLVADSRGARGALEDGVARAPLESATR